MIENIDWQILSDCNRKCKYCFGPKNYNQLSISEMKHIIDIMSENGVKQIGITGGEPLLYNNFETLIEYINSKDILIYLSTNCDYYYKYKDLIKEKVSIIGIPIDGSNEVTHDYLRGKGSYSSVINTIQDIFDSNTNLKIKIGSVITKKNLFDVLDIGNLISKYEEKIIFWKLYELISYDRNQKFVSQLLPDCDWIKTIKGFDFSFNKSKIVFDSKAKRDKSYFFLKPNADVFVPVLTGETSYEKIIGNILTDDYNLLSIRFNEIANYKGYNKKYRYMKII